MIILSRMSYQYANYKLSPKARPVELQATLEGIDGFEFLDSDRTRLVCGTGQRQRTFLPSVEQERLALLGKER